MKVESQDCRLEFSFRDGRAIDKFGEDKLERKQFARFLAEAITRHPGKESLAIALNAPWGEGKTSLKNMILDLLETEHQNRIVTISFTPWEWASQNQVAEAFFGEIAKQLELKDSSAQAHEAGSRLRMLGRYLGLAGQLVGPAGLLAEPVLPGSSIVAVALGRGLTKAKEVASEASNQMERNAELSRKSLPQIKDELRNSLIKYVTERNRLLLVVVDDIDRLSPDEMRLVFQMIRVNADFPGIVFLLLYDESFVVKSLEKFFASDSRRFLEKIVQFQIGLPILVENGLRDHLLRELSELFHSRPAYQRLFDEARFQKFWEEGLSKYITNLRHATRLLTSFQFHLGVFRSDDAEVNPIDLLVLECLRLHEPLVYEAIPRSANFFFPLWETSLLFQMGGDNGSDEWDRGAAGIVARATDKETSRVLLQQLFPEQQPRNAPYGLTTDAHRLAGERRVCSILYFSRYFRMTIDEKDISDARIANLVSLFDEPSRFVAELDILSKQKYLSLALTKLLSREDYAPSMKPVEMIAAICDFAERSADSEYPAHHISISGAMHTLVELQQPATLTSSERFQRYSDAMKQSGAIHFPVELVRAEDTKEHRSEESTAHERKEIGPHLEKPEVARFNNLIADRLEHALLHGEVECSASWVSSFEWYCGFMKDRAKQQMPALLLRLPCVKLMLRCFINDQAAEQGGHYMDHFAVGIQKWIETMVGLKTFDAVVEKHRIELERSDTRISSRFTLYQKIRAKASQSGIATVSPELTIEDSQEPPTSP